MQASLYLNNTVSFSWLPPDGCMIHRTVGSLDCHQQLVFWLRSPLAFLWQGRGSVKCEQILLTIDFSCPGSQWWGTAKSFHFIAGNHQGEDDWLLGTNAECFLEGGREIIASAPDSLALHCKLIRVGTVSSYVFVQNLVQWGSAVTGASELLEYKYIVRMALILGCALVTLQCSPLAKRL